MNAMRAKKLIEFLNKFPDAEIVIAHLNNDNVWVHLPLNECNFDMVRYSDHNSGYVIDENSEWDGSKAVVILS